jgi:hypothetical protein
MDFHVLSAGGAAHVMTTHRCEVDETPLQLVSAARVAHWMRIEQEHAELLLKHATGEGDSKP